MFLQRMKLQVCSCTRASGTVVKSNAISSSLTKQSSGTGRRSLPLSNSRSFSSVSSALRIALLALKISSMNATSAVGR